MASSKNAGVEDKSVKNKPVKSGVKKANYGWHGKNLSDPKEFQLKK